MRQTGMASSPAFLSPLAISGCWRGDSAWAVAAPLHSSMSSGACSWACTPRTTRKRATIVCCSEQKQLPNSESSRPQGPDAGHMGFVGPDHLGIAFTCGVCDTRITKSIKRKSYETGVVLIKCPGCEKFHVIADNLGQYRGVTEGKRNVEELAAERGQSFTRVKTSVYELEKLLNNSKVSRADSTGDKEADTESETESGSGDESPDDRD